jgi:hypothetical protein
MQSQSVGQAVQCAHCQGTGICHTRIYDKYAYSCSVCYAQGDKKKVDYQHCNGGTVCRYLCSICNGKGFVWVGVENVTVKEYIVKEN